MSHEGVTLISRVALVAVLLIVTALVRVLVGPSRRRGAYMGIGTLGGHVDWCRGCLADVPVDHD